MIAVQPLRSTLAFVSFFASCCSARARSGAKALIRRRPIRPRDHRAGRAAAPPRAVAGSADAARDDRGDRQVHRSVDRQCGRRREGRRRNAGRCDRRGGRHRQGRGRRGRDGCAPALDEHGLGSSSARLRRTARPIATARRSRCARQRASRAGKSSTSRRPTNVRRRCGAKGARPTEGMQRRVICFPGGLRVGSRSCPRKRASCNPALADTENLVVTDRPPRGR